MKTLPTLEEMVNFVHDQNIQPTFDLYSEKEDGRISACAVGIVAAMNGKTGDEVDGPYYLVSELGYADDEARALEKGFMGWMNWGDDDGDAYRLGDRLAHALQDKLPSFDSHHWDNDDDEQDEE